MSEQDFDSQPNQDKAKRRVHLPKMLSLRHREERQSQMCSDVVAHPEIESETHPDKLSIPPHEAETAYSLACKSGDILGACRATGEDLGIESDHFQPGIAQIQNDNTGDIFTIIVANAARSGFSQVREFYAPLSPKFIGSASSSAESTSLAIQQKDAKYVSSLVGLYKHSLLPGSFSLVSPKGECLYGLVVKGEEAEAATGEDLEAIFTQAGYIDVESNYDNHMGPLERVDGRPLGHYPDDVVLDTDKATALMRPSTPTGFLSLPEADLPYKERKSSGVNPSKFPDPMEWYHNNSLMEPYEDDTSNPENQKPEKLLLDAWQ